MDYHLHCCLYLEMFTFIEICNITGLFTLQIVIKQMNKHQKDMNFLLFSQQGL